MRKHWNVILAGKYELQEILPKIFHLGYQTNSVMLNVYVILYRYSADHSQLDKRVRVTRE